jgi:hypothetical protein
MVFILFLLKIANKFIISITNPKIMCFKLFLLSSIILFNHTVLKAQTKGELLSFYNEFELVELDLLYVYTTGRQKKAVYDSKSSYSFKGKAIGSSFMKEPTQKGILKLLRKGGLFIPSKND